MSTAAFFQDRIATDTRLAKHLLHPLRDKDPRVFDDPENKEIERVFPTAVVTLAAGDVSLARGYGTPAGAPMYGFNWLPFMYSQDSNITSPLEKLVYRVLEAVTVHTGKEGGSLLSAWGDFHPVFHYRLGDAWETDQSTGVSLVDPTRYKGLSDE